MNNNENYHKRASLLGIDNNSDESLSKNNVNSDSEGSNQGKKRKARGKAKVYCFEQTYETLELAQKALSDEEIWTLSGKKFEKIKKSNNLFYRCNRVLQRANPQ